MGGERRGRRGDVVGATTPTLLVHASDERGRGEKKIRKEKEKKGEGGEGEEGEVASATELNRPSILGKIS